MTYKKVHRLAGLWVFLFMFMMLPGTVFVFGTLIPLSDYRTGQVINRPIDWTMLLIGCACFGLSAWGYARSQQYIRLRRKIYKAWEKKFDDVEFLELHARHNWRFQGIHLRDSFPGMRSALWCVSKLWAGRKTSETVHLDYLVADVVRDVGAKRFEDKSEFYKCLLAGVLYGVIEPTNSEPQAFRIGRLVFQCAKEHYPLEEFEIPTENNQINNEHILAT